MTSRSEPQLDRLRGWMNAGTGTVHTSAECPAFGRVSASDVRDVELVGRQLLVLDAHGREIPSGRLCRWCFW